MCTLTFIPLGNQGFVFTTNRDENPLRTALPPSIYIQNGCQVSYPKDKESGGTWIFCHEKKYCVCLLNGAFEKHIHEPPYRKSRGLVVLEYSGYRNSIDFVLQYDFDGIEPFTMIAVRYLKTLELEEIRWDGNSVHFRVLDSSKPEIWSSSTLYNAQARLMRTNWFEEWLRTAKFSGNSLLHFHKTAGVEDRFNGLIINRKGKMRTTSITQVVKKKDKILMHYEDLLQQQIHKIKIEKSPC